MIGTLVVPWRRSLTWRSLVYAVTGLAFGVVCFTVTAVLMALSVGFVVLLPAVVVTGWLLFTVSAALGRAERSRLRGLLGLHIADPHPALPDGWWRRLLARARTGSRWREIAYLLLLLPLGVVGAALVLAVWCGSAVLFVLPAFVGTLPRGVADFGPFEVGLGAGAAVASALGLVGILGAPWLTLGVGRAGGAVGRRLLGPSPSAEMASRLRRAERGREAAVDAGEAERRRIERDLHDGAQQRLVALALDLGLAREKFDRDPEAARALVDEAHEEAKRALVELRGLVRGIHPAILDERGLDAALSSVVARARVPVDLTVHVTPRPGRAVEGTAYFVVSEALTNVDRHAGATRARVAVTRIGERLVIEVGDDGGGGADPSLGSGLQGLEERVAGMGGWMKVISPAGGPTDVMVELPCGS